MFHRTYTCKKCEQTSQNSLRTLSLKNVLRDGTIAPSSTLSSSTSMMADNKQRREHGVHALYCRIRMSDLSLPT